MSAPRPAPPPRPAPRIRSGTRLIGAVSVQGGDGKIRTVAIDELEPLARQGLRKGDQIGGYRLTDLLASGGMGEVWKARDLRLDREVALKFMLRRSQRGLVRFAREAQVVAALDHPHIARIFDFSPDPPFLAMQLVRGAPLAGKDPRSLRALRDAALAIDHAHQRGVLHRDVKPGNILVDDQGYATVVDFGLAIILSREAAPGARGDITISGEIVGTPSFMAPEQARGDSAAITVQTDVYGLGATLHCLLRDGEPPFDGATAFDVIDAVLEDEPAAPPGDHDLGTIALTAMAKDPGKRYASARDFAADLDRWLRREPILARRPSAWYRLRRSIRRSPSIWGLSGALALAVVIGLWAAVQGFLSEQDRLQAQLRVAKAERASSDKDRLLNEAQLVASEQRLQEEQRRQADERRALEAERQRLRTLDVQRFIEEQRRLLREHDDLLAMAMSSPDELTGARAGLDAIIEAIRMGLKNWPDEAVLHVLLGDALYLRQDDGGAQRAYAQALVAPDGPLSAQLDVATQARLGRARSLLRAVVLDYPVQRLLLRSDGDNAIAQARLTVDADLEPIAAAAADYDLRVLRLWKNYLDAAGQPPPGLREEVEREAARGGRRNEHLLLLSGILASSQALDGAAAEEALRRAERLYTAATEKYHALPQAWLLRAVARQGLGDLPGAETDAAQAILLRPGYPLALLLRGLIREQRGDLAGAGLDCDAAAALAPHEPMVWYHRARLHLASGGLVEAATDLMEAVRVAKLAPEFDGDATVWLAIGRLYAQVNLRSVAATAYREAADQGAAEAVLEHFALLQRDQDLAGTEALLEDAQVRFPALYPQLLMHRADLLQRRGELVQARLELDRALALRLDDAGLRLLRGEQGRLERRHDEALRELTAAAAWCAEQERRAGGVAAASAELRSLACAVQLSLAQLHHEHGDATAAWAARAQAEERAEGMQRVRVRIFSAKLHRGIGSGHTAEAAIADARELLQDAAAAALQRRDLLGVEAIVHEGRALLQEASFGVFTLTQVANIRVQCDRRLREIWQGE